jgi:hypothetical protein
MLDPTGTMIELRLLPDCPRAVGTRETRSPKTRHRVREHNRISAVFHCVTPSLKLAQLTLAIVAINGWNRLNVAFRTPAGKYKSAIMSKTG